MTTSGRRRKVGIGPVIVALVGAAFVGLGAGMLSAPAGLIIAGAEMIIAAYLLAYWRARG